MTFWQGKLEKIAIQWCEENNIPYSLDVRPPPYTPEEENLYREQNIANTDERKTFSVISLG